MQQRQVDWRRSGVLELSSLGYTEREIANTLAQSITLQSIEIWHICESKHNKVYKNIFMK